jgi:hypothetical protein
MRALHCLLAVAVGAALASCTTVSKAPDPVLTGRTQELAIRTDPPGAACSIVQEGKVVASVESTPGSASVPRNFGFLMFTPTIESITPMEVVCRKEGYLEHRATFAVAWARDVSREVTPEPEVSPAEAAGTAIGKVALAGGAVMLDGYAAAMAMANPVAAAAAAAVVLPVAVGVLVVALIANKDAPPRAEYAYRALPEFFLTPSTFDSEGACDTFFATLTTKLETARDTQRARIDAECRFWPCQSSDPTPCRDPVCERQRVRADALLKGQLDQLPALRMQVRIAAPSE